MEIEVTTLRLRVDSRLYRLPCGKPLAFRSPIMIKEEASPRGGVAAKRIGAVTESPRLSEIRRPQIRTKRLETCLLLCMPPNV